MKYLVLIACLLALGCPALLKDFDCSAPALEEGEVRPPDFSWDLEKRAHCALRYTSNPGYGCDVLEQVVYDNVLAFSPEPFPANGIYTLDACHVGDMHGDFIQAHRQTGDRKYIDEVVLAFNEVDGRCIVEGSSRATVDSWWDYHTNYCNIRNLMRNIPEAFSERPEVLNCLFVPEDTVAECDLH